MNKYISILSLIMLATTSSAFGQGLPKQVRDSHRQGLQRLQKRFLLPAKTVRALRQDLAAEKPFEESVALLHKLVQAYFDADLAREGVLKIRADLKQKSMIPFRSVAFPKEVELTRLTLHEKGPALLVTTRSLRDSWGKLMTDRQLGGQKSITFEICFQAEKGRMWLATQQVRKSERVKVPFPKRWVVVNHGEQVDAKGPLIVDATWFVPNSPPLDLRERISLRLVRMTKGCSLFQHAAHGLVATRVTGELKELAKSQSHSPSFAYDAGWRLPFELKKVPALPKLTTLIARLRKAAPHVRWPGPFEPDAERAKWVMTQPAIIDEKDPEGSLLRLRHGLCYGQKLPTLGKDSPRKWVILEDAVQAYLLGEGPLGDITSITKNWRDVAAAIKHSPRFAPTPKAGFKGSHYWQFPKDYSGWRKWPVLVALHTQGSGKLVTKIEVNKWTPNLTSELAPVLLAPDFGSRAGAPRSEIDDQKVLGPLRDLMLRYSIDPDRVYLTGMSMGGAKSWHLASTYPGKWAGVAPRGHGPAWVFQKTGKGRFPLSGNLERLPLYLMLGQFEGLNAIYAGRIMRELQKADAPAVFQSFPYVGHWELWWHLPKALHWLKSKRRQAHPSIVSHTAYHSWTGNQAWLTVRDVPRSRKLWRAKDGGFDPSLATGVQVTFKDNEIQLKKLRGR
ncbi:MAG: hypothetical protein P1V97_34780, partial [Planctomycetota bacterium]|nr:hypothetical protein [Planctomycetota bacterium]